MAWNSEIIKEMMTKFDYIQINICEQEQQTSWTLWEDKQQNKKKIVIHSERPNFFKV